MVRLVARWLCSALLVGVVGTMSGCSGPPNGGGTTGGQGNPGGDGGSPGGNGGSPSGDDGNPTDADEVPAWFESWETADLGPKRDGEMFTADAGLPWEVYIDRGVQPPMQCSEAGVEIVQGVEGRDLRLHARSDMETQPGCVFSIAAAYSTGLHRIPLSRDTRILGSWRCAVGFEHPPGLQVLAGHASGFILISSGLGCDVRYLHDASITSIDDDFASTYIVVGDNFDRNLYDDMVAICGQDFGERYDGAILEQLRTVTPAVIRANAAAPLFRYGGGVAESTCHIDDLKIGGCTPTIIGFEDEPRREHIPFAGTPPHWSARLDLVAQLNAGAPTFELIGSIVYGFSMDDAGNLTIFGPSPSGSCPSSTICVIELVPFQQQRGIIVEGGVNIRAEANSCLINSSHSLRWVQTITTNVPQDGCPTSPDSYNDAVPKPPCAGDTDPLPFYYPDDCTLTYSDGNPVPCICDKVRPPPTGCP